VKAAGDDLDLAQKLYLTCAEQGATGLVWSELRQLRKAYDEGMKIVGPGFDEWASRTTVELAKARSSLDQHVGQVAARSRELYECRLQLQQRDAELEQVRTALTEQVALVSDRSAALYEHRLQLQQRDAELEQMRGTQLQQANALSELEHRLAEQQITLQSREVDLAQLRSSLRDLQVNITSRRWLFGRLLKGSKKPR
jgi:DNA repair exonuclease SbcCD ATPase subunit